MHFTLLVLWASLVFLLSISVVSMFSIRTGKIKGLSGRVLKLQLSTKSQSLPSLSYPKFGFTVHHTDPNSLARTGTISTPHGDIQTPSFIFCATKAAMKTSTPDVLKAEGTQIVLSNTYHLLISPGSELIEKLGKLHKFMGWDGPLLTDSGGYQIFSMGHGSVSSEIKGSRGKEMKWTPTLSSITEDGAVFKSHLDGSMINLSPEKSMKIQRELGADIVLVFDECTPFHVDKRYTEESMHRSHRWAVRCIREFAKHDTSDQALYGIVQGGVFPDLREQSINFCNSNPFFGIAIGGSLGATKQDMQQVVEFVGERLRRDRPVHLLGIGGIMDIFHGVRQGIDTFDCVNPSRIARHGGALVKANVWNEDPAPDLGPSTWTLAEKNALQISKQKLQQRMALHEEAVAKAKISGKAPPPMSNLLLNPPLSPLIKKKFRPPSINIRESVDLTNARFRCDTRPIEADCQCYTCRTYSRAYLHHCFQCEEYLGGQLVTIHNIHFMNNLMTNIRSAIESGTLDELEAQYIHPELRAKLMGVSNEETNESFPVK